MNRRRVVALVGLSGVGKSTHLKAARGKIVFEHLQASELIKEERERQNNEPIDRDLLRGGNIDENQALLVSGFMRRAPKEGLVVLDGHVVIDTPTGLTEIPPSVFLSIGVSRFLALVDDVRNIALRRSSDSQRKRPLRSIEELAEHQERSVLAAYRAALALGAPLFVLPLTEDLDIAALLDL
ncbi:ATP-binding protein [Azospirillum thermophilum]|uniref:Adenylate kinase n=1 Tax=Azospirillum thermophilum TaxID=2202148 RepID=A0A2S2CZC4_9PROT|nr:AAA family ATPase [Azospirillum thermophilum]AWK89856.1 adenylate kinase [Azospirillum thermophilum]